MSLDITCPYCGTEQTLDPEEIEFEDEYKTQTWCCKCDKAINITVHIDVDLDAEECPCQLEHHKYRLQRDLFLEENEGLVKDFLMID